MIVCLTCYRCHIRLILDFNWGLMFSLFSVLHRRTKVDPVSVALMSVKTNISHLQKRNPLKSTTSPVAQKIRKTGHVCFCFFMSSCEMRWLT